MIRRAALVAVLLGMSLLGGGLSPTPAAGQAGDQCFPETGACLSSAFKRYWETNGGLAVFGFPITPVRDERNRDTGETYPTQWFERNRFELHGDQILLGRLGDDRLRQLGVNWQNAPPATPQSGCQFVPETGRNLCDQADGLGFKTFWINRGGLAFFGFPLTEATPETNASGDRVLTQWFERARFEWHPDKPDAFKVLLGLLGRELAPTMPPGAPPAVAPTPAPASMPSCGPVEPQGVAAVACVNDANPPRRSDVTVYGRLTADGQGVAGVPMSTTWRYKTTAATCSGVTNADGIAACTNGIGGATSGFTVVIAVAFAYQGRTYRATTSFTPR